MTSSNFRERVYLAVQQIPYGRVASYGDIAALVGEPRAARGVGQALHALPQGSTVPWWRVINARGVVTTPSYGGALQRSLLEQEGVVFRSGTIDLRTFRWKPDHGR